MRVRFWGVRGSFPVPGINTQRWGGNTSCVEIRGKKAIPVVFDAGTGLRECGASLAQEGVQELVLVLSHFHVDHLIGLPFFRPFHQSGVKIYLGVPAQTVEEARLRIEAYINGVFHPLRLRDFEASVEIFPVVPGSQWSLHGWNWSTFRLPHPGGAVAYRLSPVGEKDSSVAYVTDTAPFAREGEGIMAGKDATSAETSAIQFLFECERVIYDTMFSYEEYLARPEWGHSYPEYALRIATEARVKELILFHHSPDADDAMVDRVVSSFVEHSSPRVFGAREGMILP